LFKWFSRKNKIGLPSPALLDLQQSTETQAKVTHKALRRLALAQQQQQENLEQTLETVSRIWSQQHKVAALLLDQNEVLRLLDELAKVSKSALDSPSTQALVKQVESFITERSGLRVTAQKGSPYPPKGCDVVGAVPVAGEIAGIVTEIIQQGYQLADGSQIRTAKVVVSQA